MIDETLKYIFQQTGMKLQLCDYFTGIRKGPEGPYFNVIIEERCWISSEYQKLERLAKAGRIKVSPNGLRRVAIHIINNT